MKTIYHIATKEDLEKASQAGFYVVESLFTEGFIHCSTLEEVVNTANRRFKGKADLVLLQLNEAAIAAPVKHENLSGGAVLYPHIYGKLNCDAIIQGYSFQPEANGEFSFPKDEARMDLFFAESHFLDLSIKQFKELKLQAEKAMAQVSDEELFYQVNSESNSIAIIVQHLSGNMISRWTDFLTTDGEKENRERDTEFELHLHTRAELMEAWERGWTVFLNSLTALKGEELLKLVYIRGEAHSVMNAILRQIAHYAAHSGQIVYLAKQLRGDAWKTLSIARGKSKEFKP